MRKRQSQDKNKEEKDFPGRKILLGLDLFLIVAIILADQAIKHWLCSLFEEKGDIVLIDGILELTYLKNTGGILGFLQNQMPFLLFIAGTLLCVAIYLLLKLPDKPRFRRLHPLFSCMLAGALGNITDRLRWGYVIDFIYFSGIHFPVFNIADILISASVVILIGLLIFFYKEKDFEFLTFKQNRYRELK